jgi:hypothetical protein
MRKPAPRRWLILDLWAIPFLATLCSFLFWKKFARWFHSFVADHPETLEEIDLKTQVVTQVVNGPVITSISVLFATLVSTTVSVLYERQVLVRESTAEQFDALDLLKILLRDKRILMKLENGLQTFPSPDTDALLRSMLTRERDAQVKDILARMLQVRSRLETTALQPPFPFMHYITLTVLALSICLSFLLATDQTLEIIGSLQVRILWTILVLAFTSLGIVLFDLSQPFVGAYHM